MDTGEKSNEEYKTKLKEVLNEESATIEHIIISHWHNDHIGVLRDVINIIADGKILHIFFFYYNS